MKYLSKTIGSLIAALAIGLCSTQPAVAMAAPAFAFGCDYSDSALFGGYGWNRNTSQSCEPAINEALGTPVLLTPVVWDGNADIANRTIQCDLHSYDASSQQYVIEQEVSQRGRTSYSGYVLRHFPLSPVTPFTGWKTTTPTEPGAAELAFEFSRWSVENGQYMGEGPLSYPSLELVTRDDGSKAVRQWVSNRFPAWFRFGRDGNVGVARPGYFECFDVSGADLVPTGSAGAATTHPATLSSFEFSVSTNVADGQPGDFINRETGETVNLVKARWDYNRDIAGAGVIGCISGFYDGSVYRREGAKSHVHPYHYSDSENRVYYRINPDREEIPPSVGSYQLTGDTLQVNFNASQQTRPFDLGYQVVPIFTSEYVELFDNGVRIWHTSDYFEECFGVTPTGSGQPISTSMCDYSNAATNGGWGWNPTTRESCAPLTEPPGNNGCDYSNASSNGGWGWNPQTMQSCAPQPTTQVSCDYSNAASNSGWGWNADTRESCPPL